MKKVNLYLIEFDEKFFNEKLYLDVPFYLLITEDYYHLIWDYIYESAVIAKLTKDFKVIEVINYSHGYWMLDGLKYSLENLKHAKELNPKQLLTHQLKSIRNLMKELLGIDY